MNNTSGHLRTTLTSQDRESSYLAFHSSSCQDKTYSLDAYSWQDVIMLYTQVVFNIDVRTWGSK